MSLNNRTRSNGHLPGKFNAYRKDNGRLDWQRMTMPSCANIGRKVPDCPPMSNMPYYFDRDVDDIRFGEVARLKCPNRVVDENGVERERVWKVKCGIGKNK